MVLTAWTAHLSIRLKEHLTSAGRGAQARSVWFFQGCQLGLAQQRMGTILLQVTQKRVRLFLKAVVGKLVILGFYEIVVLIQRTIKVYAVRFEDASNATSPNLPSSGPHEIVSSVATLAWLQNVAEFSRLTLPSFRCLCVRPKASTLNGAMQTFDGSLSTRYGDKVSGIVNISSMANHAAQQHALWMSWNRTDDDWSEVLIFNHKLNTKFWDPTCVLAKLALLRQTRHQPLQPPNCNDKGSGVHFVPHSGVEQRSLAHTLRAYRRRTQYERNYTSTDYVVYENGGRALELHVFFFLHMCFCCDTCFFFIKCFFTKVFFG